MTTRQRASQEHTPGARPPLESETTPPDAARDAGHAFLLAADRALDRALSTDPERFLEQNRQLGGQ